MQTTANHILVIGLTWPEPDSSAAGSRMMQLLAIFKSENWTITFASPAQETPFSVQLAKEGIITARIKPNDESFAIFLKEQNPTVVLFDRFIMEEQFGWRVAEVCPQALRILDTEDLHFLRKARRKAVKENRTITITDLQSEVAKREIAAILRCDISLIISTFERTLLIEKFSLNPEIVWYLPFLITPPTDKYFLTLPSFEERLHFMFVGNFLHPPNFDAVMYLKKEVWPLIHTKLPQAEFHVYGAYSSQKVQQLENKRENFFIKGRAANLEKVLQEHRVLLAPLRFGAGLKGKFVAAMQQGTPSVTTKIGAEGLCGDYPFGGKVEESSTVLAQAAITLYTDKKQWEEAQRAGKKLLEGRFNKKQFEEKFVARLKKWLSHIEVYRSRNFTGAMLLHHRQQSTKYMARWIEAKNQNQPKK